MEFSKREDGVRRTSETSLPDVPCALIRVDGHESESDEDLSEETRDVLTCEGGVREASDATVLCIGGRNCTRLERDRFAFVQDRYMKCSDSVTTVGLVALKMLVLNQARASLMARWANPHMNGAMMFSYGNATYFVIFEHPGRQDWLLPHYRDVKEFGRLKAPSHSYWSGVDGPCEMTDADLITNFKAWHMKISLPWHYVVRGKLATEIPTQTYNRLYMIMQAIDYAAENNASWNEACRLCGHSMPS